MENQLHITQANHADTAVQAQRIKKMKADLTTTNFKLGDDRDKTSYLSTNKIAMEQIATHPLDSKEMQEKAELNKNMKEAVKKSSLDFGNEKINYESVMTGQMKRVSANGGSNVDFEKRKKEIGDMTATLRRHNFSLGDHKVRGAQYYLFDCMDVYF